MKKEIKEESIEGSRLRLVKSLVSKYLGKLIKQRTLESTIREIENSGGTLIININAEVHVDSSGNYIVNNLVVNE